MAVERYRVRGMGRAVVGLPAAALVMRMHSS